MIMRRSNALSDGKSLTLERHLTPALQCTVHAAALLVMVVRSSLDQRCISITGTVDILHHTCEYRRNVVERMQYE